MIVVSDTTPIISFIKIGRLDLLEKLFVDVLVPEAVFRELTANEAFKEEAEIVKNASFIKIQPIKNKQALEILQATSGLDDGESEAIVLSGEQNSDVLIIDERKGRKVAKKLGIKITGTLGILVQSCNENLISSDEIKSYLETLKNSNIRLSDKLIEDALSLI